MKGIIKSIVDECADSVVRAVMAERKIGRNDFYNSRLPRHVRARVIAMERLRAMGFSARELAKYVKRTESVVRHSLNPEIRRNLHAARVQARRNTAEMQINA